MQRIRYIGSIWIFALASACATVPSKQVIELDPLVLQSDAAGKVSLIEARPLFKEASKHYKERRFVKAAQRFVQLAELFPKSPYAPHARFNAGLALMKLKQWQKALGQLDLARGALRGTADEWDAVLQKAACHEELKQWNQATPALAAVLKHAKLPIADRIETRSRYGVALYENGELALAEREFKKVLAQNRRHNDIPRLHGNEHVSRAQYLTGKIYRDLFRSIKFRLPVERMERDLLDKSSFFLKSQSAFLRCIRLRNRYFSVAAGFQLGQLYESMYDHMMAAEIPSEFDADDRKIYFEELKKHIKPLVMRAIDIYERNLGMSDRRGEGADWARKTQASLERMRNVLRSEFYRPTKP